MLVLAQDAALPLDDAGPYVAGAFLVFFLLVLLYVAIMAGKLSRIERELEELNAIAAQRERHGGPGSDAGPAASPSKGTSE